jgi:YfiH family protein
VCDGDVGRDADDGELRRRELTGQPWTTVHQVHGDKVVVVDGPLGRLDDRADGIVTCAPDAPIAVFGADCSLIALTSSEGVVGIAHAGWRGLEAGIIPAVVDAMRAEGAGEIVAVVGPTIGPECYEFGSADLDRVAARIGPTIRGRTSRGAPALDLPAGVGAVLGELDIATVATTGGCTACSDGWFSWRARRDTARHALVIWRVAS